MAQDYNKTLNLPATEFQMRANLPQREPLMLAQWEESKLYENLIKNNEEKPLYVLHDGPPFANGDIHLGTAFNKILKDFIVRYKNMAGLKSPFIPGFDTHGLPIEIKARKFAGIDNSAAVTTLQIRKICKDFALKYINDQTNQFKRLGVMGQWDDPYLTLKPEFEAKQIEVFGSMALKGYIYKGKKPVYWCPDCSTALAEAEIEYSDDPCYSIYVKFAVTDDKGLFKGLGIDINKVYFVIWTTTTWTLPGNVAICLGPDFDYSVVSANGEYYVIANELAESTMKAAGIEEYEIVGAFKGSELEYVETAHPFLDRKSLVIVGDHVTLESGTGCVHTAPGHGLEDFEVCRNYPQLPIVVPVDSKGKMTDEAGRFVGLTTDEANKAIALHLNETGALLATDKIVHQYPHCWRCKEPVLFRATEQWFCSIDTFKKQVLEEIDSVEWMPAWGKDRITAMVSDRSDWCISRQRVWGVPIPVFYCEKCNNELITKESIAAVSDLFRKEGSDAWFKYEAGEILPKGTVCPVCGAKEFRKESDIMDVWFDSGSTHAAVCDENPKLRWPADLYLEGGDQFRGWFQSSLLTSVAWRGKAPYRTVVTHGMVVDGEGRKMSKSLGNGIDPQEVIDQYGADILRLWVASSDYHADVRMSRDILKQLSEAYRKIRNTARFILGNISDFDPEKDSVELKDLHEIDKWALNKLAALVARVKKAYDSFEFHQVYHSMHNFCVVDMSNFYLDVLKDRLYVEGTDSKSRRAAQTVIYTILSAMTRLIAPILPFTAEEIWQYLPSREGMDSGSVMFNGMPEEAYIELDKDFNERWEFILSLRERVKKSLEEAREQKIIGSSLEAKVKLSCPQKLFDAAKAVEGLLAQVLIVSDVEMALKDGIEEIEVQTLKADGEKCERCWVYSQSVGESAEHPTLCSRCAGILK